MHTRTYKNRIINVIKVSDLPNRTHDYLALIDGIQHGSYTGICDAVNTCQTAIDQGFTLTIFTKRDPLQNSKVIK